MRAFLVRLPSGVRYWTVLDEDLRVVPVADGFLRQVRFGRDGAESTTRSYACSIALFLRWWTTPGLLEAPQPGEDGAMSNPRYTAEMRERAVKMVMQVRRESGQEKGAVARVAQQLGIGREALRGWVAQAEVDSGARPGTTSDDKQRIKELERENSELRRANEILKAASAYFARELGPSLPR